MDFERPVRKALACLIEEAFWWRGWRKKGREQKKKEAGKESMNFGKQLVGAEQSTRNANLGPQPSRDVPPLSIVPSEAPLSRRKPPPRRKVKPYDLLGPPLEKSLRSQYCNTWKTRQVTCVAKKETKTFFFLSILVYFSDYFQFSHSRKVNV